MTLLALVAAQGDGISKNTLEVIALGLIIICAIIYLVSRARR